MPDQDTATNAPTEDTSRGPGHADPAAPEPPAPEVGTDADDGVETEGADQDEQTNAGSASYDPLADPKVQAQIRKEAERAAKKAAKKAREEAEAEAKKAAERAKLDEVARLKAEKEDAAREIDRLKSEHAATLAEQELTNALISGGHQPAGAMALDFIRQAVRAKTAADEDLTTADAVAKVLEEAPYLLRPAEQAPAAPQNTVTQQPAAPPSTAPTAQPRRPAAPATKKPTPAVDTLNMSDAEYAKYRRETHNLSS